MSSRPSAARVASPDEITQPFTTHRKPASGSYTTSPAASPDELEWCQRRVLVATIREYQAKQDMYRGVIGVRAWKLLELERERATAQLLRKMGRG